MIEKIAVSIIVPVYNREKLINRCLDSLVYQSLEEIEIIVIDDHSQDHSKEYINEYVHNFPDKVKMYTNPSKGVASARNYGISCAKGEYIAFVDSDDYVELWAYERLYKLAKENEDIRIITAPYYKVQNGYVQVMGTGILGLTIDEQIKSNQFFHNYYACNKLYKKEIFDIYGKIPNLKFGEDTVFNTKVLLNEKQIMQFSEPFYYYEACDDSITRTKSKENLNDMLRGIDMLFQICDNSCYDFLKILSVLRLNTNYDFFSIYKKEYITYLKKNYSFLLDCKILNDEEEFRDTKKKFIENTRIQCKEIPKRVYLNGFIQGAESKKIELEKSNLLNDYEIIIINRENSMIDESNSLISVAYNLGKNEFVGEYYIIKQIYENGGIFVHNDIKLTESLDYFLNDGCFFGYAGEEKVTGKVFGGYKEHYVFKYVLKTYRMESLYEDKFESVASRLKTILVVKAGVPFNRERTYVDVYRDIVVYNAFVLLYRIPDVVNITQIRCCNLLNDQESIIIPYKMLNSFKINSTFYKHLIIENNRKNKKLNILKNNFDKVYNMNLARYKYIQTIRRENKRLKNSLSWKITKPLRLIRKLVK